MRRWMKQLGMAFLSCGLVGTLAGARGQQQVMARKVVGNGDNKKLSDYVPYPVRTIEAFPGLEVVRTDKYGGRADRQGTRTGFFHTQKMGNRWWIIDPEGGLYLSNGIDSVNLSKVDDTRTAFKAGFGNSRKWMEDTQALLLKNGNNSVGAWSDVDQLRGSSLQKDHPLSYSINLHIIGEFELQHAGGKSAYPKDFLPIFDPKFASFASSFIKNIEANKSDPNILGYFSDNEIPLNTNNLDVLLHQPKNNPGRVAAENWMLQQKATVATDELRAAFLEFEATRYFEIVSTAIRQRDPNHMYLGCRFYARQLRQPEMFRAAGKYADIISVNFYNRWEAEPDTVDMWEQTSGKPYLISEFYTKAEDTGIQNSAGAGWVVHSQNDRGLFYENIVLSFLASRSCVGWHWFKYRDDDPSVDHFQDTNVGSNKGIVNAAFVPYQPLLKDMQAINRNMYALADALDKAPARHDATPVASGGSQ